MLNTSMLRLPASCVLAILALPATGAEQLAVDLDAAKTNVAFVLSDVLHTVRGTFRLKQGHFVFDESTGLISGEVIVDAASGNSGNSARDKRMTRDILEAQRYPEIRVTPVKIAGLVSTATTPSTVQVTGSFWIHGQAHDITIPTRVQMSQHDITASGKFIVPYVEWGMKNPSNFLLKVNKQVEIDLTAVGHLERP